MNYSYLIIVLLILFLLGVIWMYATKGDKKIFTGKMVGLALKTAAISLFFSTLILLYNQPLAWLGTLGLLLAMTVAYGLFAWWYWYKRHLLDLDIFALFKWEFPQAFTLTVLSGLVVISAFQAKHSFISPGGTAGEANLAAGAPVIVLLPLFFVYAYQCWNRIPVRIKYYEPWRLPVESDAPVIEPSADALRIFFQVPVREKSEDLIHFDVQIPRKVSLGEVFHHILYQHNVQERSHRQIVIAHENKTSYLYGWLLYRNRKRWWWWNREYLDMQSPVRYSNLINGERIYAERVRIWENKIKKL